MRTKFSLILSLLCAPLAFWACGDEGSSTNGNSVAEEFEDSPSSSSWSEATGSKDDSSSRVIPSEVEGSVDYVWETADDRVKCKNTRSGKTAYYEPDDAVLVCEYDEDSDEWAWTEYVDNGNENADPDIHRGDDEDTGSKSSSSSRVISSGVERSSSSVASSNSVKSSSSVTSSDSDWTWDVPKEARLNPEITYGTMTDARDGKKYKTVEICNKDKSLCQTWMAENLNYADSAKTVSLKGKSWCYDNKDANCEVTGRLYTWAAAIDSAALVNDTENPQTCGYGKTCELTEPVQGVCPSGWHLPSYAEWQALFTAVGGISEAGKALKSSSGWCSGGNGTDAYGFTALPAGFRDIGNFYSAGCNALFWSASELDSYGAYRMSLGYGSDNALLRNRDKYYGFSVRCLQN